MNAKHTWKQSKAKHTWKQSIKSCKKHVFSDPMYIFSENVAGKFSFLPKKIIVMLIVRKIT